MGVMSRGIRDAFRNGARTLSIILILALSIAMSLVMLLALKTVDAKINSVKSSIGNTISVSPAGLRGFEGSGTLLTTQDATETKALAHVTSVVETLTGRLTTIGSNSSSFFGGQSNNSSNAQTSLSAPPRQEPSGGNSNGRRFVINGQFVPGGSFSMPITALGINDFSDLSALNASSFTIISGVKIDPTSSGDAAMVGKSLASENNLSVGKTFTAYGKTITVDGIFDAGNTFANDMIILPLSTEQNLSGNTGQIDSMIVTVDSVDNLSSVAAAITDKLGSSSVDVTTSQDQINSAVTSLQNIKTISTYSLIGSLVAGSMIILLTMVMIVRERRREIGVLKAIGGSNIKIVAQFVSEALCLTLVSSVIGMILGMAFSNPVLQALVNNNSSPENGGMRNFGGGPGGAILRFSNGAGSALRNIHAVVGWDIILYGLLAAIIVAIIGSAIPSFLISKVQPAEVMRAE